MSERLRRFGEKIIIPEVGEFKVVPAVNATGCVDPRDTSETPPKPYYLESQYRVGAARIPGASFGHAMSLVAATNITPEQAIDTVYEWEQSEGRITTWHRDDHTHGDNSGCGHMDLAASGEHEDLYGLPSSAVRKMREYMRNRVRGGEITVKQANLTGSHKESGVLVVKSHDKTVDPRTGDKNFFRHDQTRHEARLCSLAKFAQGKGIPVREEDLRAAAQKQTEATLALLAEDFPVYDVDLRDGTVTYKGRVPKRSK